MRRAPLVLVVEDDPDTRELYAAWLGCAGFSVIVASDGLEGVIHTRSVRPDAVLMDIAMPRMDGITATRQITSDPETEDIPVVVISAHATEEYRLAALNAGAVEFLSKTCELETLTRRLWLHTAAT